MKMDRSSGYFAPDLRSASAVSERELVKGGFSASAGAGAKLFQAAKVWGGG